MDQCQHIIKINGTVCILRSGLSIFRLASPFIRRDERLVRRSVVMARGFPLRSCELELEKYHWSLLAWSSVVMWILSHLQPSRDRAEWTHQRDYREKSLHCFIPLPLTLHFYLNGHQWGYISLSPHKLSFSQCRSLNLDSPPTIILEIYDPFSLYHADINYIKNGNILSSIVHENKLNLCWNSFHFLSVELWKCVKISFPHSSKEMH